MVEKETKHFVVDGMQQMTSHPINCLSSRSTTQPKILLCNIYIFLKPIVIDRYYPGYSRGYGGLAK